jgi:hypothetical protein
MEDLTAKYSLQTWPSLPQMHSPTVTRIEIDQGTILGRTIYLLKLFYLFPITIPFHSTSYPLFLKILCNITQFA